MGWGPFKLWLSEMWHSVCIRTYIFCKTNNSGNVVKGKAFKEDGNTVGQGERGGDREGYRAETPYEYAYHSYGTSLKLKGI